MNSKKKQKKISIEEYIETYCQEKRIRGRHAVYVSPETHQRLKRITMLFKTTHYLTTSSLADSIITRHIETYRELLNNFHEEEERKFSESMKERRLNKIENDNEAQDYYDEEE